MTRRYSIVIASLILAVGVAGDVWAETPADQVRLQIDRVVKLLADPGLNAPGREQERHDAIRKIGEETFDLAEMARRTLGPHWQGLTEAQRAEFVTLFADLLDRAYFARIAAYNGEKVTVLGDSIDGGLATVRTRIVTQRAPRPRWITECSGAEIAGSSTTSRSKA